MKSSPSKISELYQAVFSDIHIGHPTTTTKSIIKNLNNALPDNEETGALDLIVLAGDVFDSLISMSSDDAIDADFWIAHLLFLCAKYDIVLRVLDGTKSHDHYQSKRFEAINEYSKIGADVRYVKDLSIEYNEKLGITMLFVPDEWDASTEKTLFAVKELMKSRGLDQVDYAYMHGQFEYQLPEIVKAPKHNSDEYLKLVKEYIFIGHVHTFSKKDRIVAQGSFDRLKHGEEEKKGHVRARVIPGVSRNLKFIKNHGARIYKTVNVVGLEIEDAVSAITAAVDPLPDDSSIRIEAEADHPIFSNMDLFIKTFPFATWSKLIRSEGNDEDDRRVEVEEDVYVPVTITRENIETILIDRILNSDPSEKMIRNCQRILHEVM